MEEENSKTLTTYTKSSRKCGLQIHLQKSFHPFNCCSIIYFFLNYSKAYYSEVLGTPVQQYFWCQCRLQGLWTVNLPHIKPILVGCCYRPPSSDQHYLEAMVRCWIRCVNWIWKLLYKYWLAQLPKAQLSPITDACCLKQVVTQPTRLSTNNKGINTASCIDHIYLSADDLYTKAVSVPIGCSDHHIVVVARKMKVPKARPRVIYKRSYRGFFWGSLPGRGQ